MSPLWPLTILNAACLDAPIVAVTWQWLIAETFQVSLSISERVVLFLTAWLIYLVDRFADSLTIPPCAPVSRRQEFCADHALIWMLLVGLVAAVDVSIGFTSLDWRTIARGAAIGLGIVIYLAVNHFAGSVWRRWPVKEIVVGFLFALGTVAAVHQWDFNFVIAVLLFAAVCSLNCLSISVWERELDFAQARESFATARPRLLWLPSAACWLLAVLALIVAAIGRISGLCICVSASALLLAILHRADFLPRDVRVAAADLVLLTPLALLTLNLPA